MNLKIERIQSAIAYQDKEQHPIVQVKALINLKGRSLNATLTITTDKMVDAADILGNIKSQFTKIL